MYAIVYFKIIADFSEAFSFVFYLTFYLTIGMLMCFLVTGIQFLVAKKSLVEFIVNVVFSAISIGLVFYLLKMNDPEFNNDEAIILEDYYKGFVMPLVFFPFLSWQILKPLIIKV